MKKLLLITMLCAIAMGNLKAQIKTSKTLRNTQNLNQVSMPDLTIVSFDAKYLGIQLVDGISKNLVQITYTIKNEGNAGVLANLVGWQGWVGYDSGIPKLIPGGGSAVSVSATDVINPGEIRQRSFRVTVPFDKNNHPLYTMYLDDLNMVKELNEQNNIAQKAITF